jgi:conjugative relaxase-like TrwC/TraI family protein
MISKYEVGDVGGAAKYYDKAFNVDGIGTADNYYLSEQAAAHWAGRGAEVLGLGGAAVDREQFVAFLEGKLPLPGSGEIQDLAKNSRGADRRAGVDFTIAPPKSVSIVGLVGGDQRVVEAHLAANARAMEWLEGHASVIRVREGGSEAQARQAGNLLYATILHQTNRENEPQLHNHNVIVAAVYDKEGGRWRSLTNDQLYKLRAKADVVYKAELAHELHRAGYELEYGKNGVDFEIAGLSAEHRELFATRSAQIKQALTERGIDPNEASWDARQAATLDSRSRKVEVPREALNAIWQETAAGAGLHLRPLVEAAQSRAERLPASAEHALAQEGKRVGPSVDRILTEVDRKAAMQAVAWGIEHLAEREQSFAMSELEVTALRFATKPTIDATQWAVEEYVTNQQLVDRGLNEKGERMVTTSKAMDQEIRLARVIEDGRGRGNVVLRSEAEFEAAVAAFEARRSAETKTTFKLSGEQIDAARNVLMHGDSVQGIQGEAGTGKTAALAMVREVAEAKGWQVLGMATSASAATELQTASGIQSQTVASFLTDQQRQIREAKAELAELGAAMAARVGYNAAAVLSEHKIGKSMRHVDGAGRASVADPSGRARIEAMKLHVVSRDIDFGESKYVFDHRRGDVFRSSTSFVNLLGTMLIDKAESMRMRSGAAPAETLGGRVRVQMLTRGADVAESLGRSMSRLEQVGTVEATAARTALYLQDRSARDPLVRDYQRKQAEIRNLERTGNREGQKTLMVMDESSLTGVADAVKIGQLAQLIGARMVYQGDVKQHGSVAAGWFFGMAQAMGMNTSVLEETRRFDKATEQTKSALAEMKVGRFGSAIAMLDSLQVGADELASKVAERYLANHQELKERGISSPRVGVVAITNNDRKAINAAIHKELTRHGLIGEKSFEMPHLDDPKLTGAQQRHVSELRAAGVNRLVFRKSYREIGVAKHDVLKVVGYDVPANRIRAINARGAEVLINPQQHDLFSPAKFEQRAYAAGDRIEARSNIHLSKGEPRINNGTAGVITRIDHQGARIQWADGRETQLAPEGLARVDYAYARTSYKEQGATNDREIIAVSKVGARVFNREAAYVAVSRAKDNTEIVTSDYKKMIASAGRDVTKTTALLHEPTRGKSVKAAPELQETFGRYRESPAPQQAIAADRPKDLGRARDQAFGL